MPRSRKTAVLVLLLALTVSPALSASPLDLWSRLEARAAAAGLRARLQHILRIVIGQSGCEMDPNGVLICKP
jgi:hypothetical protein